MYPFCFHGWGRRNDDYDSNFLQGGLTTYITLGQLLIFVMIVSVLVPIDTVVDPFYPTSQRLEFSVYET